MEFRILDTQAKVDDYNRLHTYAGSVPYRLGDKIQIRKSEVARFEKPKPVTESTE